MQLTGESTIKVKRRGIRLGTLLKIFVATGILAMSRKENGKSRPLWLEESAAINDDFVVRLQIESIRSGRHLEERGVCHRCAHAPEERRARNHSAICVSLFSERVRAAF